MVKRLAHIVALSIAMPPALAQTMTDVQARQGDGAYLQDSRGIVVRSPFGLCWRSGTWTPVDALIGCDGQLTPPVANPTAPEPLLPAPVPPPAAQTPVAPPPCDFTVTLANDEIFGFNKAVLSQSARRRLDEQVVGRLAACSRIDRLTVFGHADRLGTPRYNQKLSERRAGAVAEYLKNKGNFAEIETRGLGETQPAASCAGSLPRRALVECLAPDRRVVIEVRGIAK
jgi:OOP family OmpA-OmpF porin